MHKKQPTTYLMTMPTSCEGSPKVWVFPAARMTLAQRNTQRHQH